MGYVTGGTVGSSVAGRRRRIGNISGTAAIGESSVIYHTGYKRQRYHSLIAWYAILGLKRCRPLDRAAVLPACATRVGSAKTSATHTGASALPRRKLSMLLLSFRTDERRTVDR